MALSCDHNGVAVVFEDSQGSALSAAFDDLLAEQKPSGLMVQLGDYPEVFQTAFADRMVRRPESAERAPAYLRSTRSAVDANPTASSSAGWSRACGRRRRGSIRG